MDTFINSIYFQNCGDTLIVKEKTSLIKNKHILYLCQFQKYPCEIYALKDAIIKGQVINPQIEQVEFINKLWPQHCGDTLRIIEKTKDNSNRIIFRCQFLNHPYEIFAYKNNILNGKVFNPQIEKDILINKEFPQNCGEILIILNILYKNNVKYYSCIFKNYPNFIFELQNISDIKKGKISKEILEDKDFIGKIFLQTYNDRLLVLENTKNKDSGGYYIYKCKFIDYDCIVFSTKQNILKKGVYNPNLPWRKKELLEKCIKENFINKKPNLKDISEFLNVSVSVIGKSIREFNLQNLIDYFDTSYEEKDLKNYINLYSSYKGNSNWNILDGKEIDIYLPDLKLGFEFNGNYWHSELFKDKNYHQEKSLLAKEKGIKLIHIWEWEWIYNQEKIQNFIKSKLGIFDKKIGASKCKIRELQNKEYQDFCEENHLQGSRGAKIKLGLFYKDELVQVMSFGVPRFTNKYEWEIIRECSKQNYLILGGKQKLWSYFVKHYSPNSVISYCDFSKFTGESYLKLGFKFKELHKPGFFWYDNKLNCVYWRNPYKHNEYKNKYLKIYNCGQLVFVWKKEILR